VPKQKTRKSISKRFKLTKSGKILRRTIGMRHLKASKSKKQSRRQKQVNYVTGTVAKKLKKVLEG
jgi:large subunit ribosomal protein L35